MSIIYDAIKKIEDKNIKENATAVFNEKDVSFIPYRKESCALPVKKNNTVFLGIYIALALFVFMGIEHYAAKKFFAVAAQIKREVRTVAAKAGLAKKTYPPATYILEGIVYDQETPFVILNGVVLHKHEKLANLEVIDITPVRVVVLNTDDNVTSTLTFLNPSVTIGSGSDALVKGKNTGVAETDNSAESSFETKKGNLGR